MKKAISTPATLFKIIFIYCFPIPLLLQMMPLKKLVAGRGERLFFTILHYTLPVIVLKYQPIMTMDLSSVSQSQLWNTQLHNLVTTTALPIGLEKHRQFLPFLHSSLANVPIGIFLNDSENNLCYIPKIPLLAIFLIIQKTVF